MDDRLHVFAKITPKSAHFAAARTAIQDIVSRTRAEPGCLAFALLEGRDDHCLYLIEQWTGQDALDHHYAQSYTAAVFAKYDGWLACPVEVTKMRGVT
ncbi:antibiotic biosynthesis monooxygenase [Pacificimonas sp. WHA3]|uniref:Antibiotic biosynthesis monooxygenase n=1 Tax=Pacificimonas pallii TaxID=2827236 RepID=A0ABS6SGG5_9SPHN|nr:putative quinol monooxygenase [Pacificimonas pallii]MBV7257504.1 antibiotic biosynthesis monooxygenase [Pacificimonas pallii]